jgi:hypothetical protein
MAMLECSVCEARKSQQLGEPQLQALSVAGACQILCESCGRPTYWSYVSHERRSGFDRRLFPKPLEPPPPPPKQAAPAAPRKGMPTMDEYRELARSALIDKRTQTERREGLKRNIRRVPLELPVRLRVVDGPAVRWEEVTRTSNVSKGGVYIQSEKSYRVGMRVFVALNFADMVLGGPLEQPGEIVRIDEIPQSNMRGIAVKFL